MVRWVCNVRPKYRISAEVLRTRLKLNSMRECLLDKRLQWLGYLKRIEENGRCSKYKSSRLVVVFLEHNLGKRGMRQSKMI